MWCYSRAWIGLLVSGKEWMGGEGRDWTPIDYQWVLHSLKMLPWQVWFTVITSEQQTVNKDKNTLHVKTTCNNNEDITNKKCCKQHSCTCQLFWVHTNGKRIYLHPNILDNQYSFGGRKVNARLIWVPVTQPAVSKQWGIKHTDSHTDWKLWNCSTYWKWHLLFTYSKYQ